MTNDNREFTTDSEPSEQTLESAADDATAFIKEMHDTDQNKQDGQVIKVNPFNRDIPLHTITIGRSRSGMTHSSTQDGAYTGGET